MQAVNPIAIIIFAPLFALMWIELGKRAPSLPAKFAIAILLVGESFVFMALVSKLAEVSLVPWELLAGYFLILGLAAVVMSAIFATQIKRLKGLMGGVH